MPHQADRLGRKARFLERGAHHVVDEHGDGAEGGGAGSEHDGVQALQQLAGDVQRDVRPRLEVRADHADRDPPLRDDQAVGERPAADLALERVESRRRQKLALEDGHPSVVQPQPVDRAFVEPARCGFDVGIVGGEHLAAAFAQHRGRGRQRDGDGLVGQTCCRRTRRAGFAFDVIANRHFCMYSRSRGRAIPAHIERG